MDMESYRRERKLTYNALVDDLRSKAANKKPFERMDASRARRIALGLILPRRDVLKAIVDGSGKEITIESMFERYDAAKRRAEPSPAH